MSCTHSRLFLVLSPAVLCSALACGSESAEPATSTVPAGGAGGSSGGPAGGGGEGGSAVDPSAICTALELPLRPWSEEPTGTHRGDLAADFSLELADGTNFTLSLAYGGCDSYLFVPDRIPVSDLDPTSVWESAEDLADLVAASPLNVHYFFVSRLTDDAAAQASIDNMQARITALLATLAPEDASHWQNRLHVVAHPAKALDSWVADVLSSSGRLGFGIDRGRRLRGAGVLADVSRYRPELNSAGYWPWEANLSYVAHEPLYYNAEALIAARLEADGATVVPLWSGEVLEEYADTTVSLPSAAELAAFDTLEVDITLQCPNPDSIEPGNCGAWDYIARLSVEESEGVHVELARFITSYHRETHWVVDASAMLAHLRAGGERTFRWSFAPSWNTQPTATHLSLRFSNQGKGVVPTQATPLWSGGPFGSTYNDSKTPVEVTVPATAQKVEFWALVTGHGAGTADCAEFCDHQHEVTVNGATYLREHPEAGTKKGCMPSIEDGMVPNQGGTWWFGRGGWCPGQRVEPWVVDVTGDVTPGATATLSYRGLHEGVPPADGSGDIDLTSFLVVYE